MIPWLLFSLSVCSVPICPIQFCNLKSYRKLSVMLNSCFSQMYRADYVKLHYVHYSTITVVSQMTAKQTKSSGESWLHRYVERHVHEFDEDKEATMLHTKTKVARNMPGWKQNCKRSSFGDGSCHLGFPVPKDIAGNFVSKDQSKVINMEGGSVSMVGKSGYGYNCFVNEKIDDYWWPRLVEAVEKRKKQTQLT